MGTYIARRLLLMVVTIFGITLVSYGIMRMTPGDVTVKLTEQTRRTGQRTNREELQALREHYNLDKPALLNFTPQSRTRYLRYRLDDYDADDDRTRNLVGAQLEELGAAALVPAFTLLAQARSDEASGRQRTVAREVAASGQPRGPLSEHILAALPHLTHQLDYAPQAPLDAEGWLRWWETHRDRLAEPTVRKQVDEYIAGRCSNESLMAALGTAATPLLLHQLASVRDPVQQARLAAVLATLHNKPKWRLEEHIVASSAEAQPLLAEVRRQWQGWAERDGRRYADLAWSSYLLRIFSETQYGTWVAKLCRLDFGVSFHYKRPVTEILLPRLRVTIQLSLLSIVLAYLIAIPLGIYSAARPYSFGDKFATLVLFVLYSLPSFWAGNLMIIYLTGGEHFPFNFPWQSTRLARTDIGWLEWGNQLVLPLLCYTYGSFAYISRQMRAGMLEVIRADYIRTARAKGLSERSVILKHALRNSLIPVLTIMANILPALIGGAVIIEQVFGIDGMGKLTFEAVFNRDYPLVMAIGFLSAVLTLIGILLSDLSYALVDPRIQYS
jgi:peptide/nickel transport system permease protein